MISFILFFSICSALPSDDGCEMGEVVARSFAVAEGYIRAGLRPGQSFIIHGCHEVPQ
mgnify:CR=1 FL=1